MEKISEKLTIHLCGYGFETASPEPVRLHFHPFYQMNLVCGGYAAVYSKSGSRVIRAGDVVLFPPGVHHCMVPGNDCGFCDYSFKFFSGRELSVPERVIFTEPELRGQQLVWIGALGKIFHSIAPPELVKEPIEFPLAGDTPGIELLESLLYGFFRRVSEGDCSTDPPLLKKVKLLVQSRKGDPVTVEECAAHLHCSAGYLLSVLKKETGMTTKEIIDRERIRIAARLLMYSDLPVSALASRMKFSDLIYFDRFFKKYTGESPRSFRKRTGCSRIN